jgi:predicted permease
MGSYYKYTGDSHGIKEIFGINWKDVFINKNQLSVVGMFVGMGLYLFDVPRPAVMGNAFDFLIHFSAWANLLPIGYLIDLRTLSTYFKKTVELIPLKIIITPLILYGLSLFFFEDTLILGTLIIAMAAPCAINALIAVRLYELNINLSMAAFISTNLFYIFVFYPLFYLLVVFDALPFK